MPDITHPLVATPFITGDVLDPDRISEGVYLPQTTTDNMSVMNGRLTADNLAGGYEFTHEEVRAGAMATTLSRGQTANMDFFDDFFRGDYVATTYATTMARGLTCIGVRFYVPYDCAMIMLSWHVGVVVDGGHVRGHNLGTFPVEEDITATGLPGSDEDNATLLVLHVDGTAIQQISRRIFTGRNSMCGKGWWNGSVFKPLPKGTWATDQFNQPVVPDHRWWSGHFNIDSNFGDGVTPLRKGWHTATIRVTNGKWTTAAGLEKVAPHVRFKTCHMTAIPIR